MKKKNIIIPIITALLGIAIGYFIFSSPNQNEDEHESHEEHEEEIWTCSMHPQIRQNQPGDCPLCGMDLIPLESTSVNPLVLEMTEEAVQLAHIQTTIVGSDQMLTSSLQVSGKIEADETTSASLTSHIPGRIEKLYISFTGERVYEGQKIATIYSPKLITAQKELLESYKMKDEQPKLYEASVNKLKNWKITDDQINEIIELQVVKENFDIYADYSGVVQKRLVSVGDHLGEGEVLFDIQNLSKLWVVFDVYEKDLELIKLGNLVTFTTPSISGKTFQSKVSFIDPVINPMTRTAKIRVDISNQDNLLKPEMFVNGEIFSANESEMNVTVPKSAVLWTGQRSVVYVKVPELSIPSFEFREVLLGQSLGDKYQVIDGLIVGEEVVTHGAFVIDASAQLNNQTSMMNRLIPGATDANYLPDYTGTTPSELKKQFQNLIEEYITIKDALVESKSNDAQANSNKLLSTLNEIQMGLLSGQEHKYWMEQSKIIKVQADHIRNESDLEIQRDYFSELSLAIVNMTKVFGVFNKIYYEQYCPMANDGNGAYWLSKEETIQNPYYGEKMLKCGEVKNLIDKNYKNEIPKANPTNNPSQGHNH